MASDQFGPLHKRVMATAKKNRWHLHWRPTTKVGPAIIAGELLATRDTGDLLWVREVTGPDGGPAMWYVDGRLDGCPFNDDPLLQVIFSDMVSRMRFLLDQ